jgi:hypothetical protein
MRQKKSCQKNKKLKDCSTDHTDFFVFFRVIRVICGLLSQQ